MILMRAAPGSSSASSASPGVGPIVGSSSALVLARSASLTSVASGGLIFNFSQLFFAARKTRVLHYFLLHTGKEPPSGVTMWFLFSPRFHCPVRQGGQNFSVHILVLINCFNAPGGHR